MKINQTQSHDPIVNRLNVVADRCPELRVAAQLYQTILPLVRDADIVAAPVQLEAEVINSCLKSGVPVLSAMELEIDSREFERLLMRLVQAVEAMPLGGQGSSRWKIWQHAPSPYLQEHQCELRTLKGMATEIRMAVAAGQLSLSEILGFLSTGDSAGLETISARLRLDPGLLLILAKNALKPTLNSCRKEIMDSMPDIHWDQGICFVCGSKAAFGELQDDDQVRHLRCGQCGADWHFNRLECLHCGNLDHRTQQTISEAGCDSRRIDACDACHGYLKVIASFSPTPPELLAVEDLATLPLDFIAQQRGYVSTVNA